MSIPKKPRKFRVCRADFQPVRCLQSVCGPECAIKQAQAKRSKAERIAGIEDRKTVKAKLETLKPLSYWADKAQIAVNAYIRARRTARPRGLRPPPRRKGQCRTLPQPRRNGRAPLSPRQHSPAMRTMQYQQERKPARIPHPPNPEDWR